MTDVPSVDGRRARRQRSRDLAVEAMLDLLAEGVIRPTAQQVAERSGVSLRSIFRIFDDVRSLHEAATEHHLARVGHLFRRIPAEGSLVERVQVTVEHLTRVYEEVGPVRRAAVRLAPESEVFAARLRDARSWARGELDRVFAPELAGRPERAAALEALLSFEAWDQLRQGQRLSVEEGRAVLVGGARSLLA